MADADAATAVEEKTVRLQVAAARQEESGQGIARMPRSAFQALGITEGDVVEITGKRATAAIAMAAAQRPCPYDGYVALGCVIRGETTHYETVCTDSSRGLMDLSVQHRLAIGNGILTVENSDQAWARADMTRKDKGGDAARAAVAMAQFATRFAAN